MELFQVVTIEEAKRAIEANFRHRLESEWISCSEALLRCSSHTVTASEDVPGFLRSTVDGYAVAAVDVKGASESMPAILELVGEVAMGQEAPVLNRRGLCMYVPTGGMLPQGADCVVMVEYSSKLDEHTVLLERPSAPLENVIQAGEDIRAGEAALVSGQILRPYEIGVLSSLGITRLQVFKRPVVGIISTGDEVVPPDEKPATGQIRDINTSLLMASVQRSGAIPKAYGIIKDEYGPLKEIVDRAVAECDLVLISGGSSVGTKDQTLKVLQAHPEGGVLVHGLAVKPGKPTIIGRINDKVVFGLPGHPLACSIIYTILVEYYLELLQGRTPDKGFGASARFSINYHKAKGREEYLPVTLERTGTGTIATPVFGKSGLITSFSKAFGYVVIDRNKEGLVAGEQVEVFRL